MTFEEWNPNPQRAPAPICTHHPARLGGEDPPSPPRPPPRSMILKPMGCKENLRQSCPIPPPGKTFINYRIIVPFRGLGPMCRLKAGAANSTWEWHAVCCTRGKIITRVAISDSQFFDFESVANRHGRSIARLQQPTPYTQVDQ